MSTTLRLRSFSRYLSMGWPETKKPRTSFSFCRRSVLVPVGRGGEGFFGVSVGWRGRGRRTCRRGRAGRRRRRAGISGRAPWPCRGRRRRWARWPKASSAPALQRDSRTRLFMRRRSIFSQNSQSEEKPCFPSALKCFARGDDGVDGVVADVLDGGEAEDGCCRRWG